MTPALIVMLIGLLLLVDVWWTHRQLTRAIHLARPARPRLARYPSVSVIRPVRGRDVGASANFAAAIDTGYPGDIETLFVVDDAADPAWPLLERAVAGDPEHARVLVAGPPPAGRTGKLNAMIAGLSAARGELVAFGDSDTRPDRQVLRSVVETLLDEPDAGSAFAPVVVENPSGTAGDAGYALLIDALYGPAVALASLATGDLPFIMGQLMVFRRTALDAIGGLDCARGQLVDDMHIGACVARAGLRNVQSSHPLTIVTGGMSMAEFFRLYRRWLMFSRSGLPRSFTWPMWQRGIEFYLGAFAFGFALVTGHYWAALFPALALAAFCGSMSNLQRVFGGTPVRPWHLWMTLALFVISPAVLVACLVHRQVTWRGRAYDLDAAARLMDRL
jgi:ceramide glucosyltransferase